MRQCLRKNVLQVSVQRPSSRAATLIGIVAIMLSGCSADDSLTLGRAVSRILVNPRPPQNTVTSRREGEVEKRPTGPLHAECRNFLHVVAEQQHDDWCWAACAQMIHAYRGRRVAQQEIVARIRGTSDRQAANYYEILLALDPGRDRDWSALLKKSRITISPMRFVTAGLRAWSISTDDLVTEIQQGWPVVVGLRVPGTDVGHVSVAFAVTYVPVDPGLLSQVLKGSLGPAVQKYTVETVEIADPWPGTGVQVVAGEDFNQRVVFMISRRQAQDVLREANRAIH